ncbi:SGNH/GDSL hydrolase family protein [Arthrobacter sp. LAPM80]|uniref:SGNH/GDSL hydrolase family protein n=1 Tax=Arthrobacter sp. LAPM80 TaxID=3141788 RepID=UPI00398B3924
MRGNPLSGKDPSAHSRLRRGGALSLARIVAWQGRAVLAGFVVVLAVVGLAAVAYADVPPWGAVKSVQVDVIGDSLSTGFRTPGDTWPGQAQALVKNMGLKADITNASENGAGYVQPGELGDVFEDLVNRIVNSQSQVVVLFGSDNDTGDPGLAAAAQATLARVKELAPHATVIVVGPTSESGDPGETLGEIRQVVSQQGAAIGARFVDPVALGWFQGTAAQFLSSDLEHPNVAGETYLAQHMGAILAPAIKSAMLQDQLRRKISTDAVSAGLGKHRRPAAQPILP